MKPFIKFKLVVYLSLIFYIVPKFAQSQSLTQSILYEKKSANRDIRITYSENVVNFNVDNSTITRIRVDENSFAFLEGKDGNSFGLANYYFGKKEEKSFLEIYLLDNDLKITLYKKINFSYEEPFPKILQISSQQFVLFFPSTGHLKVYNANLEKDFDFLRESENKFFQERIGHLNLIDNRLIIFLSQIRKTDGFYSKIFSIDLNTFEVNQIEVELDIIYKTFQFSSTIYFTGIKTEPVLEGSFYSLDINLYNFNDSEIKKIADLFVEGQVKNSDKIFFSKDCFYHIPITEKIEKLNLCFSDEIIIDALTTEKNYFVLTRNELKSNLYEINSYFEIIKKETIEQYLSNPEINILSNDLIVKDKNKIVFAKNLSEE